MIRHRVHAIVLITALATALTACGSDNKPAATVGPSSAAPTQQPASTAPSMAYESSVFMPGLRFAWPAAGWRVHESVNDLVIDPPGLPGATLHVAKGLFPTDRQGSFLTTRISPERVATALSRLRGLTVSRPARERIGDGLAAMRLDLRLAPAPSEGFGYLSYKGIGAGTSFTISRGMVVRVYTASYRAPYGRELLNVAIEAPNERVFRRWTALADRALHSLRLPSGLKAGRSYMA